LIREISLQSTLRGAQHAIQLTVDQFVVCTSWFDGSAWRSNDVVEVNARGEVVIDYKTQLQSTTQHHFSYPHQLAVDKNNECIFVADNIGDRIVMLSRSLKRAAREFNASVDGSRLHSPQCLYLNHSNSRLYVGEYVQGGRIFVFDIRPRC
jgi:DNA-binding beta-propeller fold protein YncE